MKLTDELLRQHAAEARDLWLETLPDEEDLPPHAFPETFLQDLAEAEGQRKKRSSSPGLRRAAAIFLAALVGVGSWCAAGTEARAAFFRWICTFTTDEVSYPFVGQAPEEVIPDFFCAWLPEGMEAEELRNSIHSGDVIYSSAGGEITFLSYHYMHDGAADFLFPSGGELCRETVEVAGLPGDYYGDPDGASVLFWFDQEAGIVFSLQSPLPREDILCMAESVEEGMALEYLPEYGFTWLPEGYTCHELVRGSHERVLSCLTEDNDQIRLEYGRLSAGTPAEQFGLETSSAPREVSVWGGPAELYPDTGDDGTASLLWCDGESGIVFHLSSAESQETMLKVAEGIARR